MCRNSEDRSEGLLYPHRKAVHGHSPLIPSPQEEDKGILVSSWLATLVEVSSGFSMGFFLS